ncbi:monocarboxylate transporter 12-B-like [Nerophis lumbriciformis]|uniref:monocarboxylate transporter 12-B-like n=1 Tax=Nerophis lumbriciformis TaxID=546530 RepID=UPI002AE0694B|nr:monocarboxylate transporter 12-B-like [Nerophis lumbriciformis]XP_061827739.1 monocarboxylate transporter 12-B-like [Nerophis lumbriciformis]XP_061827825.1 monocarboxylate transporter 12-B-like [Nerophis lumbriciformis]XP_061827892.1 monocarboxylate transporter 12-B-like [Nerophis lumbriciformis]
MQEKMEKGKGSPEVTTPPEGGWGWMVVAGCFLVTICTRGVTRCVAMFFVEFQLHFERDYSTTAWIHSLIDCTTMFCAPLGSFLVNRLSCRATMMLGGLMSSIGLVLSCFASRLEHLYVSLGILAGVGFALNFTPSIAMVGRYFSEKKAVAYGIALSGSGIGTFILAPVIQLLIDQYSWRGAMLVLGGFVSNLCVCGALMRPVQPRTGQRARQSGDGNMAQEVDAKEEPSGHSVEDPKSLEISSFSRTQRLLIANGALQSCELEESQLPPGKVALPPSGPEAGSTDIKLAECILLGNKLTPAMLGELQVSDAKLTKRVQDEHNKMGEDADKGVNSPGCCRWLQPGRDFGFLLIPDFMIWSLCFLFMAYACSTPVVYLVPYAISQGVEKKQAAFLMSIFGISGIVGNITFGWITDRKCLNRYRMLSFMLSVAVEGLCCWSLPLLHSFAPLALFAVVYGYFEGAYVALIPVVTSDAVGSDYLNSALGVVYFLHAIPYLVSPPIGGWLVDVTGNYAGTFFLSGTSFILSSVVLAIAMLVRHSWKTNLSCPKRAECQQNII